MNEQANIELVKQCYDAFVKRDMQRLLGYMDAGIDWRLPEIEGVPFSGRRSGREQVAEFFRMLDELQEFRTFSPAEFTAQNDKVICQGHYDWTVKATHAQASADWAHVFTIRNGKVVAFCEYSDTHKAALAYQGTPAAARRPAEGARPSVH
ncbi:MAG: nuclear transport factor 2 family protein [Telluria sp.]